MDKKKAKAKSKKPPMKYWLVELTLTSGRVRTFYVKARFQYEAYRKADYYASLVSNKHLFNALTDEFRLLT
jgi:hypothetical protein